MGSNCSSARETCGVTVGKTDGKRLPRAHGKLGCFSFKFELSKTHWFCQIGQTSTVVVMGVKLPPVSSSFAAKHWSVNVTPVKTKNQLHRQKVLLHPGYYRSYLRIHFPYKITTYPPCPASHAPQHAINAQALQDFERLVQDQGRLSVPLGPLKKIHCRGDSLQDEVYCLQLLSMRT